MTKKGLNISLLLISIAALGLEVTLIRLFQISFWHHFAQLAISLSLLGLGFSGTYLALFKKHFKNPLTSYFLLVAFSFSTLWGYVLSQRIPFDPYVVVWQRWQLFYLLGYYLLLGLPFFFFGLFIARLFQLYPQQAPQLYFWNLLGSALGCFIPWTYSWWGGTGTLLFLALLPLLALPFLYHSPPRYLRFFRTLSVLALIATLCLNPQLPQKISPYKGLSLALNLPYAHRVQTRWNQLSRVDVVEAPTLHYAPGLSWQFRGTIPPQKGLSVDADSLFALYQYQGDPQSLAFTNYTTNALAYHLRPSAQTLIIGPGGGGEVLTALYHQAQKITAVEMNPLLITLVRDEYARFSGNLYQHPKISVVEDEGRRFIKGDKTKYDVISISLLDSLAAASSGAYSASENYLYTVEAIRDYYQRLAEGGLLSITRWLRLPPRDGVRIFSTAIAALEQEGVKDPGRYLCFLYSWATGTIILKKGTFEQPEIAAVKNFCRERRFDLAYLEGLEARESNLYNRMTEPLFYRLCRQMLNKQERVRLYDSYLFDLRPPSDDQPFFFHFFKLKTLPQLMKTVGKEWLPFVEGGYLVLWAALLQAAFISVILILLPLVFRRRGVGVQNFEPLRPSWGLFLYFFSLGLGYMFLEMALIQKFILLLGSPVYALSVILFTLLLSSSLGSLLSARFKDPPQAVYISIAAISILSLAYLITIPTIIPIFFPFPFYLRAAFCVVFLLPLGLFMGIPFPSGIRLLSASETAIPWAYAINGCASVLGPILASLLAMAWGFKLVLGLAALVYMGGGLGGFRYMWVKR